MKIDIIVYIRNNQTGEIREYKDYTWQDDDGKPSDYIWESGNYSCDCNRHLFFQRVKDEEETDVKCGMEKYSVNLKEIKTGKIFYKEF